jgi:hypothetical protein
MSAVLTRVRLCLLERIGCQKPFSFVEKFVLYEKLARRVNPMARIGNSGLTPALDIRWPPASYVGPWR